MFLSASVRTHDTQSADVTSASVSSAGPPPPAPRARRPSGRGSCGARLLTTIAEWWGSVRDTYALIEPPGRRRSTLLMKGLSAPSSSIYVGVGPGDGLVGGGGVGDGVGCGDGLGWADGL